MPKELQKRPRQGHRHRIKGILLSDEIREKNSPNLSILYEIFYGNRDRVAELATKYVAFLREQVFRKTFQVK